MSIWSWAAEEQRGTKRKKWGVEMTGQREGLGRHEGKRQKSEDRQRKLKEGGVALGEQCNLKATKWLHEGPADEI